jgi:hypothetical protein
MKSFIQLLLVAAIFGSLLEVNARAAEKEKKEKRYEQFL